MDAARRAGPRLFVEDSRRNGGFLRVTWHGDEQQFVVSNWEGNLCVGATRVSVEEVPGLVGLLAEGLADAAARAGAADPPAPRTLLQHLRAWWRDRGRTAVVLPLERGVAAARDRFRASA
jgi:hypothetical protein